MSYKVLIVDDSKLARMTAVRALNALRPHWYAVEMSDPTEAVNVMEIAKPHMALVDFNMGGKDGLTLLAELRSLRPDMPIIMVSANGQDAVIASARAHGANFIQKPWSRERFGELLDEAERQIRASRPERPTEKQTKSILDEDELDALIELVNMGVSQAAKQLAGMVSEQVLLSVPRVEMMTLEGAAQLVSERDAKNLIAIHQLFDGEIAGRAILIFPEAKSLELVRAVVGGDLPVEELMELEQEAIAETGNVILNGCLSMIANLLRRNLKISLPEVLRGDSANIFRTDTGIANDDHTVMFIFINFLVLGRNIDGYMALLMDVPSLMTLKTLLAEFIARSTGTPA